MQQLLPHMLLALQHTLLPRHVCPAWQQLGPHTLAGLQQPPPGRTPPIAQHVPVSGSHCWSVPQQRRLLEEPQALDVGQQAPFTQLLPTGQQVLPQACPDAQHVVRPTQT